MLKFSPLNDEKFFNPLYKRQEISAKEMADFEKLRLLLEFLWQSLLNFFVDCHARLVALSQ